MSLIIIVHSCLAIKVQRPTTRNVSFVFIAPPTIKSFFEDSLKTKQHDLFLHMLPIFIWILAPKS